MQLFKTDDIKLQKNIIAEELHYNSVLKERLALGKRDKRSTP